MSNYKSETYFFLGKTPTHISQEKLLDYFLYTYEFVWITSSYERYRDSIYMHFKELLDELKLRNEKSLTLGQEWWALVFFALRDLAKEENFPFAIGTIEYILNRIHTLSDNELEDYANSINNIFNEEMPNILIVRPLEIQKLQSERYQSDYVVAYFLDKKDNFLTIFQKYLTEKDIDKKYMNMLFVNDRKLVEQFTDFWKIYIEMYIRFSISLFEIIIKSPEKHNKNSKSMLESSNLVFLRYSLNKNVKMQNLNKDLTKLLLPLYSETLRNFR